MKTPWTGCGADFKSPVRVVVQFLFRSRETKANRCRDLKQELDETRRLLARQQAECDRQGQEICELKQRTQRLEIEKEILAQATSPFPADPSVGTHGYGARMIALSVSLAQAVGLRGAQRVMEIFFVAGSQTENSPCNDNPNLVAAGRSGRSEGTARAGRRLGVAGGSLQSNRAREDAGGARRPGLPTASAGKGADT